MDAMNEATAPGRRRVVLPPKGLLLCLLAQAPLAAWYWPPAPAPVEAVAGALLLVAGAALNVWADVLFRRNAVGVCPFSPVPRLIEDGPFRYTRNPMYAGLVLIAAGTALLTGVLPNLWAPAAFGIWLHRRFVLPEEAFLQTQVGAAFDRYARRVPRWLGVPAARADARLSR